MLRLPRLHVRNDGYPSDRDRAAGSEDPATVARLIAAAGLFDLDDVCAELRHCCVANGPANTCGNR
jgi:hypothetical protein